MSAKRAPSKHYFLPSQYDSDGHLKPPFIVYLTLIYLVRVLFVLAGALGMGSNTDAILGIFYPDIKLLYGHIIIAIMALFCCYLVFHRKWLFDNDKIKIFSVLKPALFMTLLADLCLHIFIGEVHHWRFSYALGIGIIAPVTLAILLLMNRTLKHYFIPMND